MTAVRLVLQLSLLTFLVSSMLGMGLGLTLRALLAPLRDARFVLVALAVNFVAAPALVFGLARVFPLPAAQVTGLMLLACAPGAPFLPRLAESAGGDPARSVALMVLLTAGTMLFMPLALPWVAGGLEATPWGIARPLLVVIVLPLVVGLVVRSRAPRLSARCRPALATLANISLVVLLAAVVVRDFRAVLELVGSGALAAAALFLAGLFVLGYVTGGPRIQGRGLMGLGAAARNVGAAFVPAAGASDPQVLTMVVASFFVMLIICPLAAAWLRRQATRSAHAHALA